jgi:GNAT superfamily N-acetyltransferase
MHQFVDLTHSHQRFFEILPSDWSAEIAPFWDAYATNTRIFGVLENDLVVAGAIVFSTVSPDTQGYAKEAQSWFDKGYLYIAFLFVSSDYRGKGLGSFWVEELRKAMPAQSFWLAIDDPELTNFYEPLGFNIQQEVLNDGTPEWILTDA